MHRLWKIVLLQLRLLVTAARKSFVIFISYNLLYLYFNLFNFKLPSLLKLNETPLKEKRRYVLKEEQMNKVLFWIV